MLVLLQPWRSLLDLKPAQLTFEGAFNAFTKTASVDVLNIIKNIQYFYECSDQARERQVNRAFDSAWRTAAVDTTQTEEDDAEELINDPQGDGDSDDGSSAEIITESDIENALQDCHSTREMLYADVAINIAEDFAIFADDPVQIASCPPRRCRDSRFCGLIWAHFTNSGNWPLLHDSHHHPYATSILFLVIPHTTRSFPAKRAIGALLSHTTRSIPART
ncbi:hypothetical protein DFJ58DRAFT_731498 [Suillus subalutaceus]|uniref:uncharacterized protein n=1 Tax=Suillus subalutaceus TaxID=48586 RepID=UPI001B88033C|nr:uncharacterized protein DFJ58DRAFT_731498 [Suillus subalutaceus]KAG1843829.1 hypothetical protein DFJ58DRAFT_731498 [Suillus subalutaceus]